MMQNDEVIRNMKEFTDTLRGLDGRIVRAWGRLSQVEQEASKVDKWELQGLMLEAFRDSGHAAEEMLAYLDVVALKWPWADECELRRALASIIDAYLGVGPVIPDSWIERDTEYRLCAAQFAASFFFGLTDLASSSTH